MPLIRSSERIAGIVTIVSQSGLYRRKIPSVHGSELCGIDLDEEVAILDEPAVARRAVGDEVGDVDAVVVLVEEVDAWGESGGIF
jgi:hypothetical protein